MYRNDLDAAHHQIAILKQDIKKLKKPSWQQRFKAWVKGQRLFKPKSPQDMEAFDYTAPGSVFRSDGSYIPPDIR
jgi:hypothetical protein